MKSANPLIEQFIIETTLIDPINSIVSKLENREFRDCDIKWLDSKLESFTKFACETLGKTIIVPSKIPSEDFVVLNKYVIDRYLKYFKILLDYFKSF